ncbi:hypothetical protein HMPREF9120_01871 [Neisseria sp. oral taxon 020 str. F0370]|nr:hypothetical protein HMPREF9120_01871 [Neisseria sp. oral taxon 020 str. F0370]
MAGDLAAGWRSGGLYRPSENWQTASGRLKGKSAVQTASA